MHNFNAGPVVRDIFNVGERDSLAESRPLRLLIRSEAYRTVVDSVGFCVEVYSNTHGEAFRSLIIADRRVVVYSLN
jgi:hypothetical protein